MPKLEPQPSKPTGRIIMWRLSDPDGGHRYFLALEDGTIAQQIGGTWSTVLIGPSDTEESFQVALGMTELAESQGARLSAGPAEFGIDEKICSDIRAGKRWDGNSSMLLIGFDMALKTGKR